MGLFRRREVRGAISIFLVAIMLPMMVISALMVDTARYQLAKSMVSSAGDLSMNAALADYDAILKDVYGLFAMSQANEADFAKNIKQYFVDTVVSYGVVGEEDAGSYIQELLGNVYEYLLVEDKEAADFLAMTVEDPDIEVTKISDSSLANAGVLEKQIVEYMKYRAPVGIAMSFLDSLSAFTKVEAQTDVTQAQVNAQSSLQDASNANYALYQAIRDYDKRYDELEPEPVTDARNHLKYYGHIFKYEYVAEYEKLHRLTLVFCLEAYSENPGLGKWTLPDTGRSNSGFVILNRAGDYVTQNEGTYSVSGHLKDTNKLFGAASSDPLGKYIIPFVVNHRVNVISTLNRYGAAKITDTSKKLENEGDWESVIAQFKTVDDFYKENYADYAAALHLLDEYAAAMEAYTIKINNEIQGLEKQWKAEEQSAAQTQKDRTELNNQTEEANGRLNQKTEEERAEGREYVENEAKLAELENSLQDAADADERSQMETELEELKQRNQDIEDHLGDDFEKIREDSDTVLSYGQIDGELLKKQAEAETNQQSYQAQKEEKEKQRDRRLIEYNQILGDCADALNSFNQDALNYKAYKKSAQDTVTKRAVNVSKEFKELYVDILTLEQRLASAEGCHKTAADAIDVYGKNVDTWNTANESYKAGNEGGDSFSEVQTADITEAKNTFSKEEVQELLIGAPSAPEPVGIQPERKLLTEFLKQIDANFTYMGGSKIKDITNADQIADNIRKASEAGRGTGFRLTCDIDAEGLNGLRKLAAPVPCCSFLNYLHQTYKDKYDAAVPELTLEQKKEQEAYDNVKESNNIAQAIENDNSGKSISEKCGYQYKATDKIGGKSYPSGGGSGGLTPGDKSNKADKDGLKANKKSANTLLKGLGNAIETGRDKLYVMAYLFENFSYNTIVQDLAREGGKEPNWFNCGEDVYKSYLNIPRTGSSVPINGANNKIYGAEIEYVLFGSDTPSNNVDRAYAGIYAIRVLFNSVYAFTSSDIRSQTRSAAMTVQAASGGIIPYQLVQVVLQLALAMGESAIDLKNMEAGAKVAVVKTKETWTLSMGVIKELAKGTFKTALRGVANAALEKVNNKINEIVDAGAEELSGLVMDIEKDFSAIANSAAEDLLNSVFAQIEALVDEEMNKVVKEIFYSDAGIPAEANLSEIRNQVLDRFYEVKESLEDKIGNLMTEVSERNKNTPLSKAACDAGGKLAVQALNALYEDLKKEIFLLTDAVSIRALVYRQIYSVKAKIDAKVKEAMSSLISEVSGTIQREIDQVSGEIKEEAGKATDEAKENVKKKINEFVDDNLQFGPTKMDTGSASSLANANGNAAQSSSKVSAIAFGYSDYLKLFVFISLCADRSGTMIQRIGDLIQLNISTAGETSQLRHRVGSEFAMDKAKTYVSVSADVKLEMMFLRFGIFRRQVDIFNEEYEEEDRIDLGETMKIHYLGIAGY